MYRLRLALALVVVAAALLPVQSRAQAPEDASSQELRRLEDELAKALVERDAETLDRLWHADLIFIMPNGQQSTKVTRLAGQSTAAPRRDGETNRNDEVDVYIHGDTAIVTVASTWTTPMGSSVSVRRYRTLHAWTRDAGSWRLRAAQVALVVN